MKKSIKLTTARLSVISYFKQQTSAQLSQYLDCLSIAVFLEIHLSYLA